MIGTDPECKEGERIICRTPKETILVLKLKYTEETRRNDDIRAGT